MYFFTMWRQVEAEVSRDPSRLWKLTKVWEERTKEIGPSGTGPVFQIFRRYRTSRNSLHLSLRYKVFSWTSSLCTMS